MQKLARYAVFKLRRLLNPPPPPSKYSTIVGRGSFVPVQLDAYFLALNKHVEDGDSVLDVGFGLGYGMNVLSIKAKEASGVDIDPLVLEYCQETLVGRNPRVKHLSLYDGYSLNFPDNSFDVITAVDVLEHVEDYHRFLKELLRVARRGIFISTPNRRPENTNPDGTPKNHWHLREWTYLELDEIVRKHSTRIDWNFLDGRWDGPFQWNTQPTSNTQALAPFIAK